MPERGHISRYCRQKLNKKYHQSRSNLQSGDAQLTLMDVFGCVRIDSAINHVYKLPLVKFKVGSIDIIGLVETRSSVNMIDTDLYDQLNQKKLIKNTNECMLQVVGITGNDLMINKSAIIEVKFHNNTLSA